VLLLAALFTAIVPSAVAGIQGGPLRAVVVGAASAVLLLSGTLITARGAREPGSVPFLDAMAGAGALGLLAVALGRPLGMVARRELDDPALDSWVLCGVVILVIAAFAIASAGT